MAAFLPATPAPQASAGDIMRGLEPLVAGALPATLAFRSAAPNPTSGELSFVYDVPRAGAVEINVYDLAGRRIARPFAGTRGPGTWATKWDGIGGDGRPVAPGMYLVRLRMGDEAATTRIIVTR